MRNNNGRNIVNQTDDYRISAVNQLVISKVEK